MRLNAAFIKQIARSTGFDPTNLEKVMRLRQLLRELHRHPFLEGRLILKGGTAVNLFYLDLPRLSVDIDLNYIGQIEREAMLEERPQIDKAVAQVCGGLGYKIQRGVDEHALLEFYLGFLDHRGNSDHVQVEINFLMRTCALPPKLQTAAPLGDEQACQFRVLAIEELLAGKVNAMIARKHPRDLYDLYRFMKSGLAHSSDLLRKLAVLFCSTLDRDFREYELQRYTTIEQTDVERLLHPLLRSSDRPSANEMLAVTKPILEAVLDYEREEAFLKAMAEGKYDPQLLFPENSEIVERVGRHPALLWKAQNVAEYLSKGRSRK